MQSWIIKHIQHANVISMSLWYFTLHKLVASRVFFLYSYEALHDLLFLICEIKVNKSFVSTEGNKIDRTSVLPRHVVRFLGRCASGYGVEYLSMQSLWGGYNIDTTKKFKSHLVVYHQELMDTLQPIRSEYSPRPHSYYRPYYTPLPYYVMGGGSSSVHRDLGTWVGNQRLACSSPHLDQIWTGSWRGAISPPGHCRGTLEQGTEPPKPLRAPVMGSPTLTSHI